MTVLWWHWLVFGLALVALEIAAAGGFYVIFFGVAALLIAGLHFLGLVEALWLQLLLFSVFSVGSLLAFRGRLMRRLDVGGGQTDIDSLVDDIGTASEDIASGAIGRIEVRGTTWTARNAGLATLPMGQRCVVVRREGLTLFVQAEEAV
jgi:membrane protein implicated in regulation of membrane protease activity